MKQQTPESFLQWPFSNINNGCPPNQSVTDTACLVARTVGGTIRKLKSSLNTYLSRHNFIHHHKLREDIRKWQFPCHKFPDKNSIRIHITHLRDRVSFHHLEKGKQVILSSMGILVEKYT